MTRVFWPAASVPVWLVISPMRLPLHRVEAAVAQRVDAELHGGRGRPRRQEKAVMRTMTPADEAERQNIGRGL